MGYSGILSTNGCFPSRGEIPVIDWMSDCLLHCGAWRLKEYSEWKRKGSEGFMTMSHEEGRV